MHDAIFDVGHGWRLPFSGISIPSAAERKQWWTRAAISAGVAICFPALAAAPDSRVHAFDQALNSRASATETLRLVCEARGLASPPVIRAVREAGVHRTPSPGTMGLLGAERADQLRYRRVRLMCGKHTLSMADNWYRPDRLTPAMNTALETSETPFGVVVRPLDFRRRTLEDVDLTAGAPSPPRWVLRHRALLTTGAGVPFSVVVETYSRDVLAPPLNPPGR